MPWGQSVAYAVVTSISYPCGNFKGGGHLLRSGAPKLAREYDLWHTMKEATNSKVLTLLIIDRFLSLKFHILITFSSENYCSFCRVIAKTVLDLSQGTMALIFMAGYSYWLCKAKNKQSSLWSDQTRRDKPLSKYSREHCCCLTTVIYRGCRGVDSNNWLRLYHTRDIDLMAWPVNTWQNI